MFGIFSKKSQKSDQNEVDQSSTEWPFNQEKNCAVITTQEVLGGEPILFASHDAEDDDWQFIGATEPNDNNGRVISLEQAVALDAGILAIAGMPPGCSASRKDQHSDWQIQH